MGKGYQQLIVVGNLGRDPEMRFTEGGKAVATFSVAATTGSGDYEHTEWFHCTAWDKAAEIINEYARKGSKMQLVGQLRTREYEKDGETKRHTTLRIDQFLFLDGRPVDADAGDDEPEQRLAPSRPAAPARQSAPARQQSSRPATSSSRKPVVMEEEDLPF